MSQRILRMIVVSLFTIVMLGMIFLFKIGSDSEKIGGKLQPVGGSVGGAYELIDQDGKTVTDKDFAETYKLIYFGFTYCPAICPTELSKMTDALDKMGTAARAIQPIFITIDPERDTAAVMKQYVGHFDERLIGMTGTPEQVKAAASAYKVYYARVDDPAATEYTMDHSSYIYFMSPDDTLLHIFRIEDSAGDMASIMQRWLEQDLSESE